MQQVVGARSNASLWSDHCTMHATIPLLRIIAVFVVILRNVQQ